MEPSTSAELSGRELDIAAARHVMEWTILHEPVEEDFWKASYPLLDVRDAGGYSLSREAGSPHIEHWQPHSDFDAAFELVAKLNASFRVEGKLSDSVRCQLTGVGGRRVEKESTSMPEAITRAALALVVKDE